MLRALKDVLFTTIVLRAISDGNNACAACNNQVAFHLSSCLLPLCPHVSAVVSISTQPKKADATHTETKTAQNVCAYLKTVVCLTTVLVHGELISFSNVMIENS